MKKLPKGVAAYSRSPVFDETSIPDALQNDHQTKAGVWGVINVQSGSLLYTIAATGETATLTPDEPGIIEPEALHHVTPVGPVSFFVEFWR